MVWDAADSCLALETAVRLDGRGTPPYYTKWRLGVPHDVAKEILKLTAIVLKINCALNLTYACPALEIYQGISDSIPDYCKAAKFNAFSFNSILNHKAQFFNYIEVLTDWLRKVSSVQ